MLDGRWRAKLERRLDPIGRGLHRSGISADGLTIVGLVVALGTSVLIANDTGRSTDEVTEALRRLEEHGFCKYHHETDTVWVVNMCREQVGDLRAGDNRINAAVTATIAIRRAAPRPFRKLTRLCKTNRPRRFGPRSRLGNYCLWDGFDMVNEG